VFELMRNPEEKLKKSKTAKITTRKNRRGIGVPVGNCMSLGRVTTGACSSPWKGGTFRAAKKNRLRNLFFSEHKKELTTKHCPGLSPAKVTGIESLESWQSKIKNVPGCSITRDGSGMTEGAVDSRRTRPNTARAMQWGET